jgi:hypothetical protein
VGFEALVERYVQLRDKKAELKAKYDGEVAHIERALEKCEQYMLAHLNEQGAESVKTKAGTFYKTQRTSVTVADWDAYFSWLRENDMWSMLEHRANKSAVEEYKAVHDDLPPGLNWRAEHVINVRRS